MVGGHRCGESVRRSAAQAQAGGAHRRIACSAVVPTRPWSPSLPLQLRATHLLIIHHQQGKQEREFFSRTAFLEAAAATILSKCFPPSQPVVVWCVFVVCDVSALFARTQQRQRGWRRGWHAEQRSSCTAALLHLLLLLLHQSEFSGLACLLTVRLRRGWNR